MKNGFLSKLSALSLTKKIILSAVSVVVIATIIVGIVLLTKNNSSQEDNTKVSSSQGDNENQNEPSPENPPETVTLTFYDENRTRSEQITVPYGSTLNADLIPTFSKPGHYLEAWSYVDSPTTYLTEKDKINKDTEFIALYMEDKPLYETSEYLHNVPELCEFVVSSTQPIHDENLSQFLEFNTLSGFKNSIICVDNKDGTYTIKPKVQYFPGDIYSLRIVNEEAVKFVKANQRDVSGDNIRKYSFSIEDTEVEDIKLSENIIEIPDTKLLGFVPDVMPDVESLMETGLSYAYFDDNIGLKRGDIIHITHDNGNKYDFYKVKSYETVEDKKNSYYGKNLAVLSIPETGEYLDEYEVRITGLDEDDIVYEDILSEQELAAIVYDELLTNMEYARAMDTLLYTAKQTDEVKNMVALLPLDEQEAFANTTYKQLAATRPSLEDFNPEFTIKRISDGNWVGFSVMVSVSPSFEIGSMGKLTLSLSCELIVKLTGWSDSFYIDNKTGLQQKTSIGAWEYATASIRSNFTTDISFKIVVEMNDNAADHAKEMDLNADISEQVEKLLDGILTDEGVSGENETAKRLLEEYLDSLDYDLFSDDLDYVELFTIPLGVLTCDICGVDFTIEINFIVEAGIRCGLTSSFKYKLEKVETSSNAFKYYDGKNLDEYALDELVEEKFGIKYSSPDFFKKYNEEKKKIKYVKTKENKQTQTLSESINFDFTIGGKVGIQAGVSIHLKISGFFLSSQAYIGFELKVGVYAELTAYAAYHYDKNLVTGQTRERLTGAVKFETGFFVTVSVDWKFFWIKGKYQIFDGRWPFFTLSTTPSVYDFDTKAEEVYYIGRQVNLKELVKEEDYKKILDLCYVDTFEKSVLSIAPAKDDLEEMKFSLIDFKVKDPSNDSDVTGNYQVSVSNQGIVSVTDYGQQRDTDIATVTVYVSMPKKNFLTGDPIGKKLTLTMPLGELIDFEHSYRIRFVDHFGKTITLASGEAMEFTLYGNEYPSKYPTKKQAMDYLMRTYSAANSWCSINGDTALDMWCDENKNSLKMEKATKDVDYYLDLDTEAYMVRYNFYDFEKKEYSHIDKYMLFGEEQVEPDELALGAGGAYITGWETSSALLLFMDKYHNTNMEGITTEKTYRAYPVSQKFYIENYALYDGKKSDIVWKFGDVELSRKTFDAGFNLSEETDGSYFGVTHGRGTYAGWDYLQIPYSPYQFFYQDGKMYNMTYANLEDILQNPVIQELIEVGMYDDEYVIQYPAIEVPYDGKVLVGLYAKPGELYPDYMKYVRLLQTEVAFGSTLTEEILSLSLLDRGDIQVSAQVDIPLPYVLNNIEDGYFYVERDENGEAKVLFDLYAKNIVDLSEARRIYVTLDANGGRFGTLPNGGAYATDADLIAPGTERFVSLELNGQLVPYDRIVKDTDYREPVNFGSRFIGWSRTPDGSDLLLEDTKINPGVGDGVEVMLYAQYESEPIAKLSFPNFSQYTYQGKVLPAYNPLYLPYLGGLAPQLPSLTASDTFEILGWAYDEYKSGDTYFTELPATPPAAGTNGYINIVPAIRNYPILAFILNNGKSFEKQEGFSLSSSKATIQTRIKDEKNILVAMPPEIEFQTFIGWKSEAEGTIFTSDAVVAEIIRQMEEKASYISFVAVYEHSSSLFTIGDLDGGAFEVTPKDKYVLQRGMTFSEGNVPVPKKEGYEFVGWKILEAGSATYYHDKTIPVGMGRYTLNAIFNQKEYEVLFDANGGNYGGAKTISGSKEKYGKPIVDKFVPYRSLYDFVGWSLSPNGDIVDPNSYTVTGDITFYAIWSPMPTPTEIPYVPPYNPGDSGSEGGGGTGGTGGSGGTGSGDTGDSEDMGDSGESGDTGGEMEQPVKSVWFLSETLKYDEEKQMFIYNDDVLKCYYGQEEECEVSFDEKGQLQYPSYEIKHEDTKEAYIIPDGYEVLFAIRIESLSPKGISVLQEKDAKIYLDGIHVVYAIPKDVILTSDMFEMGEPAIFPRVVPKNKADKTQIRFERFYSIEEVSGSVLPKWLSGEYSTNIVAVTGSTFNVVDIPDYYLIDVSIDSDDTISIPDFVIQPGEPDVPENKEKVVLILEDSLTEIGKSSLIEMGARRYLYEGSISYYVELPNNVKLKREWIKLDQYPIFHLAYVTKKE